jgi:hypothetical protein
MVNEKVAYSKGWKVFSLDQTISSGLRWRKEGRENQSPHGQEGGRSERVKLKKGVQVCQPKRPQDFNPPIKVKSASRFVFAYHILKRIVKGNFLMMQGKGGIENDEGLHIA